LGKRNVKKKKEGIKRHSRTWDRCCWNKDST